MPLTTNFVRGSNPVWYFVDLVGKQTDGSFYLWTLTNTIPYIPQAVFHDVNGLIPWTDPIEFLANGTLPIDIFFDDTQVYRLEIRQNDGTAPPSQADALIYLVENYTPAGGAGGITPPGAGVITGNQISNPQFAVVNFESPLTISSAGTTEIAPGWFLDLTGAGTVTINQLPLSTTQPNPTNAPYTLQINVVGWNSPPILRQRFQQNGMNWQNKTVSTSITARIDGISQNIISRMIASNGNPVGGVLINAPLTNSFIEFQGNAVIPAFVNLNLPPSAYIDYQILLPQNGVSYITSVQVTESATPGNVEYQQDTIDRQIDHLFHYYKPQLEYKPISSYLVGWDFPFNPTQAYGESVAVNIPASVGANKSRYVWDQTIIFQTVNDSVAVSRDVTTKGIKLTASLAGQFAMIQYLEAAEARELLSQRMSVFIRGRTNNIAGYNATVSLWATDDPNLPDLKAANYNSAITALSATGVPTMGNGNWTQIGRGGLGAAQFQLTSINTDFTFNNWDPDGNIIATTATYFVIVIGFQAVAIINDYMVIDQVGLCAGDMATRPAPKTKSETLLDCQRYFWKTFAQGTPPATMIIPGRILWQVLNATNTFVNANMVQYPTTLRANPINTIYSPVTNTNTFRSTGTANFDMASTAITDSANKSILLAAVSNGTGVQGDAITGQITSDARLGIVL